VIKINKELQTSMTHSPAHLKQAIVSASALFVPSVSSSLECRQVLF